jgi:multidrug efflux pump subunit AcrB
VVGLAFGRFSVASFGPIAYVIGVVLGLLGGANLPWIFNTFNRFFTRLEKLYANLLQTLIRRRKLILAALGTGIVLTVLAFGALPSAFIPEEDQGYGLGIFQLQNGASLSQTQKTGLEIAKVLKAEPDITAASIVSGYGFNGSSPDQGVFFYGFKPLEERQGADQSAEAIVNRLNKKLGAISSGLAVAAQPPAIPGFSAQGGFYFQFNDLSNGAYSIPQLDDLANKLVAAGSVSGDFSTLYTQVSPSAPAFSLTVDRSLLGALNVDFQQAMQTIAVLAGGNYSGLTYENGQVRNIYVQSDADSRSDLSDVLSYYVHNKDDKLVQVSEFASVELSSAPPVISHYNLYRTILLQGAEAMRDSAGRTMALIEQEIGVIEPMVKENIAPETRLLELQRELEAARGQFDAGRVAMSQAQAGIAAIEGEISNRKEAYMLQAIDELSMVVADLSELGEALPLLEERVTRTVIRAPMDGIVYRLNYRTPGGYIKTGDVVLELVPTGEDLVVAAQIDPKDISNIRLEDAVRIRLSAYDSSRYGSVDGRVTFTW